MEALSPRQLWKWRAGFYQYFDRVKSAAERWGVVLSGRCDMVPFIDRVAAGPGLVVATGRCGHGFGIGPGVGRVVADLVAGHPVGRFSRSSKIAVAPKHQRLYSRGPWRYLRRFPPMRPACPICFAVSTLAPRIRRLPWQTATAPG